MQIADDAPEAARFDLGPPRAGGLRILGLLTTGEVCVCHIHESLKISQPKASRHLAYLRRTGLVATRREGLWVYYRLAPAASPLVATIHQAVTHTLSHLDAVRKDTQRLQRQNGCCLPAVAGSPSYACCQPALPHGGTSPVGPTM